jgi:hypothetical protein
MDEGNAADGCFSAVRQRLSFHPAIVNLKGLEEKNLHPFDFPVTPCHILPPFFDFMTV